MYLKCDNSLHQASGFVMVDDLGADLAIEFVDQPVALRDDFKRIPFLQLDFLYGAGCLR